jgi:hypothetical protein
VPKPRLIDSVVETFISFGLLDEFNISEVALEGFVRQVGAYTRQLLRLNVSTFRVIHASTIRLDVSTVRGLFGEFHS